MDTSKHTVTLPIDDYNRLIRDNNDLSDRLELAEAKVCLIQEVLDNYKMHWSKRLEEIKTILG